MAEAYLKVILERCAKHAGRILVVEDDRVVVGFVAVLGRAEPEAPDEEQALHAYVPDLVELSAYRGKGLGRRLLQHADAFATNSGVRILRIGVLSRNDSAAKLYRDFGFGDFRLQPVKRLE